MRIRKKKTNPTLTFVFARYNRPCVRGLNAKRQPAKKGAELLGDQLKLIR